MPTPERNDEPATDAGRRWAEQLADWAIPDEILSQAPTSPWAHDTRTFSVDATLDRDALSATVARSVLPPTGASVLDVGCGGGRAAMSLVPPAERVIGIDESPAMLASFVNAAGEAGARASTVQGRWPDVADEAPIADVVTCHHVAYNVADIESFVLELTAHARLAVVLVLPVVHPQSCWTPAWKHFWDLDRPTGPTSDDLVLVLDELGLEVERWEAPRPPLSSHRADRSTLVPTALRTLCLDESRTDEMTAYLAEHEPAWVRTHTVLRWPGDPS